MSNERTINVKRFLIELDADFRRWEKHQNEANKNAAESFRQVEAAHGRMARRLILTLWGLGILTAWNAGLTAWILWR